MIIRLHRFHGYNSLRHVYSRGETTRSGSLALKFIANPQRHSYRAAVVVSRKVHKSAVVRNRIRRRIYEVIRAQEPHMTEAYDIVITVFSADIAEITAPALRQQLVGQLVKAGIITAQPPHEGHDIVEAKERSA